ncbi:MAG: hypothetical protein ACT4O2_14195 [Beijerinckiaceae bacterium]
MTFAVSAAVRGVPLARRFECPRQIDRFLLRLVAEALRISLGLLGGGELLQALDVILDLIDLRREGFGLAGGSRR